MRTVNDKKPSDATRLPALFLAHGAPPLLDEAGWVRELAAWSAELPRPQSILMIQRKGPGAQMALPTREHFVPLLVALGAAAEGEAVQFPISGFWMGSLARRSVQFG